MAKENQVSHNRLMRMDYAKQTPQRLFQDRDRDQYDIFVEINRTPQNKIEGNNLLQSRCNPKLLFITSPMVKKATPVPPNAPIKFKKHFPKEGLKPKKLRFTDKEVEEIENRNHAQKATDCVIKIYGLKLITERINVLKLIIKRIDHMEKNNMKEK
nr:PREDICTED: uncharacterized protein LOC105674303 [Linepithema humile]